MSKDKKTRQQKIIADLRRRLAEPATQREYSPQDSLPTSAFKYRLENHQPTDSFVSSSVNTYSYLVHDLLKTVYVTCGIVTLELLLFYFGKK